MIPLHSILHRSSLQLVRVVRSFSSAQDQLIAAVRSSNLQAVQTFLGKHPDLVRGSEGSDSALHWAAAAGNIQIMNALLKSGGSPNQLNAHRATPLHQAAGWGQLEMCKSLLAAGADPWAVDADGRTPLDIAIDGCFDDVIKLIESSQKSRPPPVLDSARGSVAADQLPTVSSLMTPPSLSPSSYRSPFIVEIQYRIKALTHLDIQKSSRRFKLAISSVFRCYLIVGSPSQMQPIPFRSLITSLILLPTRLHNMKLSCAKSLQLVRHYWIQRDICQICATFPALNSFAP